MEYELSYLHQKTEFSYDQIANWAKAGIIPKPRIENTGRRGGKKAFYSEEALNRLLILKNLQKEFPVTKKRKIKLLSSLTKKSSIGLPGVAFILFILGYIDKDIIRNVRKFIKQACKNTRKIMKKNKELKEFNKQLEKEINKCNIPLPLPVANMMYEKLYSGTKQKTVKELCKESEDGLIDFGISAMNKIAHLDKSSEELINEKYPKFCSQILAKMPSVNEIPTLIDKLSDDEIEKMREHYLLEIGLWYKMEENLLKKFSKANELSALAVRGAMFYISSKNNKLTCFELLNLNEKANIEKKRAEQEFKEKKARKLGNFPFLLSRN